jgi:hypothetical protein
VEGTRQRFFALLFSPCGLCRVPPHGKGFAVFRRAFAVLFANTAKPCFPVVYGAMILGKFGNSELKSKEFVF